MLPFFTNFWQLNHGRLLHGIKTALATGLGIWILKSVPLPVDQWLVITILVVMCAQISVGGMLQKSYMRFLGTLGGSLIAGLTLLLFQNSPLAYEIVLILAAFIFSYLATSPSSFVDAGTLGAVTVAIILMNKHPTLMTAVIRFFEITAGILIAFLISRFVFPFQAKNYLKQDVADNLGRLEQCFTAVLSGDESKKTHEIEETIIRSFVNQRKLIKDADREILISSFDNKTFNEMVVCEREILRGIDFLHYALQLSDRAKRFVNEFVPLNHFILQIQTSLALSTRALQEKTLTMPEEVNLEWVDKVLPQLFSQKELAARDIQHISLLLFCMRTVKIRVHELANCINRVNAVKVRKPPS